MGILTCLVKYLQYSISTHQRVANGSSKPALLAFLLALLLAQTDAEIRHHLAYRDAESHSVSAVPSRRIRRWIFRRVPPRVFALLGAPRNIMPDFGHGKELYYNPGS